MLILCCMKQSFTFYIQHLSVARCRVFPVRKVKLAMSDQKAKRAAPFRPRTASLVIMENQAKKASPASPARKATTERKGLRVKRASKARRARWAPRGPPDFTGNRAGGAPVGGLVSRASG